MRRWANTTVTPESGGHEVHIGFSNKYPPSMNSSVAFIGAGPTTIYTLHALLSGAQRACDLTIFEEQPVAGRGTPYRPGWNDPAMLSNIASIEIPPLEETLLGWLQQQSEARLAQMDIDSDQIDERAFYPRLVLGEFFKDQFQAMIDRARARGFKVDIRTRCRVTDIEVGPDSNILAIKATRAPEIQMHFDYLVLATGHQWPENPEAKPGYFVSPWPASALAAIGPVNIGIRGSSLTAIDAAVALASMHGEFEEAGSRLRYVPAPTTESFHLTMMSRKGLLPEADFYFPVPYEPLTMCNAQAVERLIENGADNLLDKTFILFKQELAAIDPAYAEKIGLADLQLEDLGERYFADRAAADPFAWAVENLEEAERNHEQKFTVPWRYAILRMHEVIALIVPHLSDEEFDRFSTYFKSVFVDDYATVPHESIKRLLALHDAGKLDILAVGERYRIDTQHTEAGALLRMGGNSRHFDAFIEATGQRPLGLSEFPFPTLLKQGMVQNAATNDGNDASRGIAIDDQFHLIADDVSSTRLFCLSLPFILGRHPFIQGITSSHEMGSIVGEQLAAALNNETRQRRESEVLQEVPP